MGSFVKQERKKSWQKAKFEAITSPEGQKAQKAMENMARAREQMPKVLGAILDVVAGRQPGPQGEQGPPGTIDGVEFGTRDRYFEDFETPEDKLKPRGVYHVSTAGEAHSIDESRIFDGRLPDAALIDGKPYLVINMPDAQLNGLYVDGVRYTHKDRETRGNVTEGKETIKTLSVPDVYPMGYIGDL